MTFFSKPVNCGFTVQRFSVCIPLLVYVIFIFVLNFSSVPLRSSEKSSLEKLFKKTIVQNKDKSVVLSVNVVDKDSLQRNFNNEDRKNFPPTELLASIFLKVDKDGDKLLTIEELSEYIHLETQKHINQGVQENYGLFISIDRDPANGVVSWAEYHKYFLLKNGLGEDYADHHNEKHRELQRSVKEIIARDKASWSEAARSDPDSLTLDEFLAFRHPESSHVTILALVDELLDKLDRDGDELLTEEEFARLQVGEGGEVLLSQGETERRAEFRSFLDIDHDGKADRKEIVMYMDPKHPRHAREEAETLVALSDIDHDGKLSLSEVLSKMDLFLGSKMVDTAKSFHDEF
ncbi:45 kDa calcium-binding protein isoform X1 [Macrosteles quadrilineatus]|uniref:45 kDa calcium-binding protein isoform X1 n=1 Tax=Macrosteles quadrilineatus TaxID=74068 RepID=UPI0023E19E09|nr:45 kDa calcium-binding protein isoform X1 [Macrosteles quadrilineatus]XP_054288987.1 45 kDa calcium-binding protein isoform X1 [Macrosteles quadrilineatus]